MSCTAKKTSPHFFSPEKLNMFDPIYCFQQAVLPEYFIICLKLLNYSTKFFKNIDIFLSFVVCKSYIEPKYLLKAINWIKHV